MTRAALALALLLFALLPSVAEARYAIPSAPQILGTSNLIVVGEVKSVEAGHYVVSVRQQIVGPKAPLSGEIKVHRRPKVRRCVPQDPAGIEPGTRWVWVLYPPSKGVYRSWVSAPFRVERSKTATGQGVERVRYFGVQPQALREAPTLATFTALIKAYRACYQVAPSGVATQKASSKDLAAFLASSPYAAELVRRTPRATPKPAQPGVRGGK